MVNPLTKTEELKMENSSNHINSLPLEKGDNFPVTTQEIANYIEKLLTFDEQSVCDRATD